MTTVRKSAILWLGFGIGFLPLLWVVTQHVGPRARAVRPDSGGSGLTTVFK